MLRVLTTAPARTVIARADRARDAQRWAKAAGLYRKALIRNPANPPIWVQYGHALKESGRHSEAEAAYRNAIRFEPGSADAHLQLGHVLKTQSKPSEAEACYLLASALDPAAPDPLRELSGFGWPEAALRELKRVAVSEPEAMPAELPWAAINRAAERLAQIEQRALQAEATAAKQHTDIAILRRAISRMLHSAPTDPPACAASVQTNAAR